MGERRGGEARGVQSGPRREDLLVNCMKVYLIMQFMNARIVDLETLLHAFGSCYVARLSQCGETNKSLTPRSSRPSSR